MKFCLPVVLLVSYLVVGSASGAEDDRHEEKRPGFFGRVVQSLNPFRSKEERDKLNEAKAPNWKRLELSMVVEPQPLKLPETRLMKVTLRLANRSKKFVQMEFPTSQRIEVLIRNKAGKLVEQWSEDQAFANEPTLVVVNPGERLEYTVNVATRDMSPGETYMVEAFFPNFEPLRVQKSIVPET
ncbi:BsuPI-related putative proteinase inhibitor [Verrucomicrobiota bacterium sgz303538]